MKTFNLIHKTLCVFITLMAYCLTAAAIGGDNDKPLRVAVAGVAHGHLNDIVSRMDRGDFEVVGVYEKDDRMRRHNGLIAHNSRIPAFADLGEMLDSIHPEAVVAYGAIYDHMKVVEECAPRGIHVMVEKPLAVDTKHARRMAKLAREHGILLLTNYETSWYSSNHEAYRMVKEGQIGDITRILVYDGHQGPIEIGCGKDFTTWLTDPVMNGGGAITDFGCYGANIATWLFDGRKPLSVYAVTNHQKPEKYPKVDDDATIILQYPDVTVQLMPSWNWPMNRKDMYIYGSKGYIYQSTPSRMSLYRDGKETDVRPTKLNAPYDDSFRYLKAAVRGEITVHPTDLASLENNLTVVEILSAAVKSARTGKPVRLK